METAGHNQLGFTAGIERGMESGLPRLQQRKRRKKKKIIIKKRAKKNSNAKNNRDKHAMISDTEFVILHSDLNNYDHYDN